MEIIQIATAALITGESLVLYFISRYRDSPWVNPVNTAYVVIDLTTGTILLLSGLGVFQVQKMIMLTSGFIHLYRDYETIRGLENRYAFNTPLLIVLNIRLLALAYIILNN